MATNNKDSDSQIPSDNKFSNAGRDHQQINDDNYSQYVTGKPNPTENWEDIGFERKRQPARDELSLEDSVKKEEKGKKEDPNFAPEVETESDKPGVVNEPS